MFIFTSNFELAFLPDGEVPSAGSVELTESQYQDLQLGINRGKLLSADSEGKPLLLDCKFYVPSIEGFYDTASDGPKPSDAIRLTEYQYEALREGLLRKKSIRLGEDGLPYLVDHRFYSPSTRGFYDTGVHDQIPSDAILISEDQHKELMEAQSQGKRIVPDKKGFPVAMDPLPPSAADVRAKRDRLISSIAWRYERHARELRSGVTPTDDINALDQYVQKLADIPSQKGFPHKVNWPILED